MPERLNPFAKTRSDHATETAEDYVEVIWRLCGFEDHPLDALVEEATSVRTTEIAAALDVAQPTATKILNRLAREGLVTIRPRQSVHLTRAGMELAQSSLKRHKLVVEFLRIVGVSEHQAELDAEGVEHHLSQEALGAIEVFVRGR